MQTFVLSTTIPPQHTDSPRISLVQTKQVDVIPISNHLHCNPKNETMDRQGIAREASLVCMGPMCLAQQADADMIYAVIAHLHGHYITFVF